jgi:hypothetical protein
MRKKHRYVLTIIAIVLCLFLVKILFFLIAKPKMVVDYPAKINALSRPLDYDPNKNGINYLNKASELYVKVPDPDDIARKLWPNEMNDVEISLLGQWLAANLDAFNAYRKAGECDYIWIRLKENSESSGNDSSKWPENEIDVRSCFFWYAKLKAFEGNFSETLEDLLAAWKVAVKCASPNHPLGMQISGLLDRQDVLDTAINIVDVYRPSAVDLEKWQKEWQRQFELDSYVPGLEAERLEYYDGIQEAFVHKKDGSGRLYWRYHGKYVPSCELVAGNLAELYWMYLGKLVFPYKDPDFLNASLIPFTGPTESGARECVDSMITRYKDLMIQLPWEVRYPEQQYVQFQETYNRMWRYLDYFVPPLHSFTIFYHRVKMRQDALITILAILRFNAQHGRYPSNLAELVQEGFLTDLPRDPFSRGPLFYIQLDDDFTLYSAGPDFADDGGKIYQSYNLLAGSPYGDEVFWPPLRKGRKNIKFVDMKTLKRFEPY